MRRLLLFCALLCTLMTPLRAEGEADFARREEGATAKPPLTEAVIESEKGGFNCERADSALRVSLLTCSPGQLTYELYGHTAIRVISPEEHYDVVFNYGVFDYNEPNFVWRFVLGECDYMLFPYGFDLFMSEYYARGSSVTEQVLNLMPKEARQLTDSLWRTCAPDRRVYRYDFLRSNCTTKARDIIEENVFGNIIYPVRPRRNTFRTILHQFTKGHEWANEGNDLLLGADVDTLITERDEMFSPIYMMWYADSAMIYRGYHRFDPLVKERHELLAANAELAAKAAAKVPSMPISPSVLWWGLLVAALLLGAWELRRHKTVWAVDMVVLTLQGVAGILIAFMVLFSTHPGVASNWQVWVLNPLPLLGVVPVVRAARKGQPSIYHHLAVFFLLIFLVIYFFIPQDFSTLILPLALILLSRAIVNILVSRTKR